MSASLTSSLVFNGVSVSYAGKSAIENISFEVKKGEIFGLMGVNGAGKTSLIKCALGLRRQDAGRITIEGLPTTDSRSKEQLAFLPEKFEPPWFLTGMEFLKFCLNLYGIPFHKDAMMSAATSLALDTQALNRKVNTYSKGMRQKLGLLGTMMTRCPLYILDEPMSGLDPLARALVKKMIREQKGSDSTIFLSSHILSDMDEICDRVAVLHNRSVQYVGTPKDLKILTHTENLEQAFLEFVEKKEAA